MVRAHYQAGEIFPEFSPETNNIVTPEKIFEDRHRHIELHADFGTSFGHAGRHEPECSRYYEVPESLKWGTATLTETGEPIRDGLYTNRGLRFWRPLDSGQIFLEIYDKQYLNRASLETSPGPVRVVGFEVGVEI